MMNAPSLHLHLLQQPNSQRTISTTIRVSGLSFTVISSCMCDVFVYFNCFSLNSQSIQPVCMCERVSSLLPSQEVPFKKILLSLSMLCVVAPFKKQFTLLLCILIFPTIGFLTDTYPHLLYFMHFLPYELSRR